MHGLTPLLAVLALASTLISPAAAAAIRTASTTEKVLGFDPDFTGTPPVIKQLPKFTGIPAVVESLHKKPMFEGTPPVLSHPPPKTQVAAAIPAPTGKVRLNQIDWQEPPTPPGGWDNLPYRPLPPQPTETRRPWYPWDDLAPGVPLPTDPHRDWKPVPLPGRPNPWQPQP